MRDDLPGHRGHPGQPSHPGQPGLADAGDLDLLEPVASGPRARCIGVVGGRGGAGASTLAAALAVTAAGSGRAVLVDLDPLGGGVDLLLGAESAPGLRWPALASASGRLSAGALAAALPVSAGAAVVSWDRGGVLTVPSAAVQAVVDASVRGFDVVVLDCPRQLDPAVAAALAGCDLVLVVVPAEVRAVAAAARVAQAVSANATEVQVVVRGPAPSRLTAPDVARVLGVPLAGWLRPEPNLDRAQERGYPPAASGRGPLAALAADLLGDLRRLRTAA